MELHSIINSVILAFTLWAMFDNKKHINKLLTANRMSRVNLTPWKRGKSKRIETPIATVEVVSLIAKHLELKLGHVEVPCSERTPATKLGLVSIHSNKNEVSI